MKTTTKVKDIWRKEVPAAKDVQAFIRTAPKETQAKLKQLRQIIKASASKSEELISYKMPTYKWKGKYLVGFAGFKKHIGFYPMSGSFLGKYKEKFKDLKTSKGTIQFPLDKPLPEGLIKTIIKERIKMVEETLKKK